MANANEIIELNCHVTLEVAHMNVGNKYLLKYRNTLLLLYITISCVSVNLSVGVLIYHLTGSNSINSRIVRKSYPVYSIISVSVPFYYR